MSLSDFQAARTLRGESFASLIIAAAGRSHADDAGNLRSAFRELFDDPGDFEHQQAASMPAVSAGALLMAAYLKADDYNERRLCGLFPLLCAEAKARWDAPGGRLRRDGAR